MMAAAGGMGLAASGPHAVESVTGVSNPSAQNQPAERGTTSAVNPLATFFGAGGQAYTRPRRRAGYGWTNAHAKRVATKKRNVRKHRASNR